MTSMPVRILIWLNRLVNSLAAALLAPVAWLPGWLSATLIAVVTGICMMAIFKYTSNQKAIERTRNGIKANLLALSLFKEDIRVGLRCQFALVCGAVRLLGLSLVPMLVMIVPTCLLLGQMALWYQARPLRVGEEAVVTVQLAESESNPNRVCELVPASVISAMIGPIRVTSKQMVCWKIVGTQPGYHDIAFDVDNRRVTKQVAVGDHFMSTSLKRPDSTFTDVMLHPREQPFSQDSPVRSIEITFPERLSWTAGSRTWLAWWFVVSMAAAFVARPLLNVKL